ncbi:MAG: OmpA family protein [Deltaproteobacteria bacterium]|nr:OmpA family protein [Deltaproteobacteria bacterium]
MKKGILLPLIFVFGVAHPLHCRAADDIQVLTPGRSARVGYQTVDENRLLVSVLDPDGRPIRGLKAEDFLVQKGDRKARILSAEPLETTQEVPLNIVLVVDNSFSMKKRRAVGPLLSALDSFLQTVRPIDNIHVVVFDERQKMLVGGRTLHTRAFHSNDVGQFRDFFKDAFGRAITSGTYLYEAMVAGLDIVRRMPGKDQKFLVVFSDGEDINSRLTERTVEEEASGIPNFEAYCVDYMPRRKMNPFLKSFAGNHGGRIWKAKSAKELLPIFQSFTTTLLYRYVVTYRIPQPPHGTLTMAPAELDFNRVTMIGGAPIADMVFFETGKAEIPDKYVLLADRAEAESFREEDLTDAMERYYNVLNLVGRRLTENPAARIRIVGCNSDSGPEEKNLDLSRRRAQAVRDYLSGVWGIAASRMEVEARNLPSHPTPMIVLGGRAENQRVEILFESEELRRAAAERFIVEINHINQIRIVPHITAEYGLSHWRLTISGDSRTIKILEGTGDLEPFYAFPLDEFGLDELAGFRNIRACIRVTDIYGDTFDTCTGLSVVRVSKREAIRELVGPPHGELKIEPETLTVEELTTVDSSPLLNYVFFETGQSEIPERYVVFSNQSETESFDERRLRGQMEKYYHLLNIIGQRLVANPETRIRIVGCNSNRGVERGRTDLSRSRAEAVRAYLRYIWGIDSWRMAIEARNSPVVASPGNLEEGRAEEEIADTESIRVFPRIQAGYGIEHWSIKLEGDGFQMDSVEGDGDLLPVYTFDLEKTGLHRIRSFQKIRATLGVTDKAGNTFNTDATSSVRFVRREERVARKLGYRVMERYALILFDFDRADIEDRNKTVLDRIIKRIEALPEATVTIVGHTGTIGNESYNMALSERRAKAVYDGILAGIMPAAERITYRGAGPHDPLYDNGLPEGRALNRTVTITIEYEKRQ